MATKITHPFVSAKADGPDSTEVKPSDWNAVHELVTDGGGGIVLGRDTTGPGDIQELPFAYTLAGGIGKWIANVVGALGLPRGTSAQRTALPQGGEMRWNTDLAAPEMYDGTTWQIMQIGAAIPTGMVMGWYPNTLPAGGWLFLNGQTIGPTGSGADHEGAQYQPLFNHIYANLANAEAPVTPGGRGANAAADWAAAKKIQLPDECGRVAAGADTMGGIASKGRLNKVTNPAGPDGTLLGNAGGEATHVLTIPEMPAHTHKYDVFAGGQFGSTGLFASPSEQRDTSSTGGGLAHNNVQPTIIRNSVIKI